MQSFQRNHNIIFLALIALKLLVSLISRLVACSARIVADKQTDSCRQTDRQTDTQNDYCNPRCACAPRVNNEIEGVNELYWEHIVFFIYNGISEKCFCCVCVCVFVGGKEGGERVFKIAVGLCQRLPAHGFLSECAGFFA